MDSLPAKDFLTSQANPPTLKIKTATRTSFAIICSPTTYGTLLQKELQQKGRTNEYLSIRNAALLKRECLRLNYLNPTVSDRLHHLRILIHTLKQIESHEINATDSETIISTFFEVMKRLMGWHHTHLLADLYRAETIKRYCEITAERFIFATSTMNTEIDLHDAIAEHERLVQNMASIISRLSPLVQYLFLSEAEHSCLIHLTNNDDETLFQPLLIDRERALLHVHLQQFGIPAQAPELRSEETDLIRQLWPSTMSINRHGNSDYFRNASNHIFDQFTMFDNSSFGQTSTNSTIHSRFDLQSISSIKSLLIRATQVSDRPQPADEPPSTQRISANHSNETNVSSEQTSNNITDVTTLEQFVQPLSDDITLSATHAMHTTPLTLKVISGSLSITIFKAHPRDCPDRRPPGDVIHLSVTYTSAAIERPLEIFIKRFTLSENGELFLYITSGGKFRQLIDAIPSSTRIRLTITCNGQTELRETTRNQSQTWFQ